MTIGLQGSSKTTWANEQVDKSQGNTINVNKDDLRAMLHNNQYSKGRESLVIKMQEAIVETALQDGKHVIISDTNLNPAHIDRVKEKFGKLAEIVIVDHFLQVPISECIRRDSLRAKPVGEKVIRDTYNRWLKKETDVNVLVQDESLPKAIICDLDGTLAHMKNRGPFEWMKVGQDSVDETVKEIVNLHAEAGYTILIVSGRDCVCQSLSIEWLNDNNITFHEIFMRPENDMRKDSIIKNEIFNDYITGKWNVKFVLDDRNQVCDLWREIGLKCLQVAPGDF